MSARCPTCNLEFSKRGLGTHVWRKHGEGQEHKPTLGQSAWNKGLRKYTDERVAKNGKAILASIQKRITAGTFVPNRMGPTARIRTSVRVTRHNPGGRCSWYEVDGEKVQGRWERDLAIKMSCLGLAWTKHGKENRSWSYVDNKGINHNYTPDFYLHEIGSQIEVKGFWWANDRNKMLFIKSQTTCQVIIVEETLLLRLLSTVTHQEFLQVLTSHT